MVINNIYEIKNKNNTNLDKTISSSTTSKKL
jgi:hypothetical protein